MSSKRRPKPKEAGLDTKQKLLKAAAEVFSEKGFGGATVKEICDRANANISLISYHFQGKEGLFCSVLEEFGKERLRDAERILTPPDSVEDFRAKLRLWMQQFLQCHVDEDNVCSILHRENVMDHDFMRDIFQNTFLKAFESVVKFFEHAKKKGIARKEVDPIAAATLLFGSLIHVGRNQKAQKAWMNTSIADEKYRNHITDQILDILLNGVIGRSE